MNEQLLSRTECNAMRGLAIIGIFLHNYCHWLNPVVKENEYQYFQQNVDWMASSILKVSNGKYFPFLLITNLSILQNFIVVWSKFRY